MANETDGKKKTVPLKPAVKNPHNVEATKHYIFNETGNIMMASTSDASQPLNDEVQQVFAEVSVFFAGMTRAITTTINPHTGENYSLYNHHALERVIGGSGLFVHVTEEDVEYSTKSVGAEFSKELIESLLGLATGAGELGFASAMVASMGKEGLRISGKSTSSESKVGNIVFVCEHLMGMPIISAIVVYADCHKNSTTIQAGPCFKAQSSSTSMTLHKDTYLFVTPSFIHQYSGDLDSVQSDPNYLMLINWFKRLVEHAPEINGIFEGDKLLSGDTEELHPDKEYTLKGSNLPVPGELIFVDSQNATISLGEESSDSSITFTVKGDLEKASEIGICEKDNPQPLATTSTTFTIKEK